MALLRKEQLFATYDWARDLRAAGPLHRQPDGGWVVVRHAEAQEVLTDHRTFSSGGSSSSLPHSDPPRHASLHALVSEPFLPQRVALLERRVAAVAEELLAGMDGAREMDVVADLAAPLPVIVIAELLGVPADRRDDFRCWSDAVVGAAGAGPRHTQATLEVGALTSYFAELIEERRRRPGDDLVSALVTAEPDPERLAKPELVGLCVLLLVAGNVTARHLISNGVLCLDHEPALPERLRREPGLLPAAVEEVLRYLSPVQSSPARTVGTATVLDGRPLAAGERVAVSIGSANRDSLVFHDAGRFDVGRHPSPHLAFGRGIHFCLGAPLARLEARVVLGLMVERLTHGWRVPDVLIEVEPPPAFLFGPRRLPLCRG
jgi:cytochrome P450